MAETSTLGPAWALEPASYAQLVNFPPGRAKAHSSVSHNFHVLPSAVEGFAPCIVLTLT